MIVVHVCEHTQEPTSPLIKAIGIHRLCEQSHGNGGGMALADIVSKKFFDALDLQLTWKHMISCNWTVGGKIPVRCECIVLSLQFSFLQP
eukprot:COSAG02_NODE_5020_length_4721_cov_2.537862_2_plen_90_part_00